MSAEQLKTIALATATLLQQRERISTLEQENARLRAELEEIRGHYRKSFKPCDCPTCEARAALSGAPREGT